MNNHPRKAQELIGLRRDLCRFQYRAVLFAMIPFVLLPSHRAELKLPAIISDHMVLQQKQANPIWGWDVPGTKVTVTFAGQTKSAEAGQDGKWTVKLDTVAANAQPQ